MDIGQYFQELQPKWRNYLKDYGGKSEYAPTPQLSAYNILNGINAMKNLAFENGFNFNYDIPRAQGLLDSFDPQGSAEGFIGEDREKTRFKANALIPGRGLWGVLKEVVQPLYEQFVGRSILSIDNSIHPAAQNYYLDYLQHSSSPREQANAQFVTTGLTDIDVTQDEYGVVTIETNLSITADEIAQFDLRNRQSFGSRIDIYQSKLEAARKSLMQLEEELWWTGALPSSDGSPRKLVKGFLDYFPQASVAGTTEHNFEDDTDTRFNYSNINRDLAFSRDLHGTAAHAWNNSTLENVVSGQMRSSIQDITAQGFFNPRLLIVPKAHWVNISSRFAAVAGTTVTKSIGELALEVLAQETSMGGAKVNHLATRALSANTYSTSGLYQYNRYIMIDNAKENWCYVVPRDVHVLPPARDDRNRINQRMRMRIGGVVGKRPFSAVMVAGI